MSADQDIVWQLKVFGLAAREARARRGWRQSELASRLGVSIGTLQKIEAGSAGTAFGTILSLSQLLNLPADPRQIASSQAQYRHLEEASPRRVAGLRVDPALDV